MKKYFHKIHLWLSVPIGLIISIICLSGAALVFEQDITQKLNPSLYWIESPKGNIPLQPSELIRQVRTQLSDSQEISSVQLSSNPDQTCMLSIKRTGKKSLSVNPYTGEVNGWTETPAFFQVTKKLHRWLMNPPAAKGAKSVGKTIVGITTLLTIVILVTGLIIWIPRTRKVLSNRLTISYRKGIRRFWYDCHVSLGFYSTIFLLLMALTGLTWSFGWYRTMAYHLLGASVSTPATVVHRDLSQKEENRKKKQSDFDYTIWDKVISKLQAEYPDYVSIRLEAQQAQVNLPGNLRRTDTVKFNPKTGEITERISYSQVPQSQKIKGWLYAFHTGSWGGITTKILYFLAALIGGILPLSGYYLWWKCTSQKR